MANRRAGILIPLFSIPSSRSWGIGEIADIGDFARWLESAGMNVLQLLPINEMPPQETSPYSAMSAMAIDPQFIAVEQVRDFVSTGGVESLPAECQAQLAAVRASATVDYAAVRRLKDTALRRAFTHFHETEWRRGTRRSAALQGYMWEQAWWLDDYALFRALHAHHGEKPWEQWPEALQRRDGHELNRARHELADDILYRQYLQWMADSQWAEARRAAGPVALFGDLPFMVSGDSADVWAHQDLFRRDASVGVPPDAFSETGQDWGLPVYRWDVLRARNFDWLHERARRNAALFAGYRIDHLVGFYRTYFRPHDGGLPQFVPQDEEDQIRLGESIIEIFRSAGSEVTAEDLGLVPDFVRESLARLNVPGYKVQRWERRWHVEGQPFKDPREYPEVAVVTSGTHDTEPMGVWWEHAPVEERQAVLAIPSIRSALTDEDRAAAINETALTAALREALITSLYASSSDLLILPVQDVFGWTVRINQPATVNSGNWTWRMPWPVDRLRSEPAAVAMAAQLAEWARKYGR
jgi:4-alpha-glucanotransferase